MEQEPCGRGRKKKYPNYKGCQRPKAEGFSMCRYHLDLHNQNQKDYYWSRGRELRRLIKAQEAEMKKKHRQNAQRLGPNRTTTVPLSAWEDPSKKF